MFSAYISERKQAEDHHDNLVIALDCNDPGKHQHPLEMSTICSVPHFLRVMGKKSIKELTKEEKSLRTTFSDEKTFKNIKNRPL